MTEKAKTRIPGKGAQGRQAPVFGLILLVVAIAAGALIGILQLYVSANERTDELHSLQLVARYAEQLRLYEGQVLASQPADFSRLATDGSPIKAVLNDLEDRSDISGISALQSRFDAYLTAFTEEERLVADEQIGSAVMLHKTWTVPAGLHFRYAVNEQLAIAGRAEDSARRIAMVGLVGVMTLAVFLVSGLLVAFDHNRRRAIELVSRQELRFRSLVEYGSDVTIVLEADGRIQFVTPAVKRMFGYTPDELIDQNLLAMIAEADRPALRTFITDAIGADGEPVRRELRFTRSARTQVTVEAVGASRIGDPAVGGIVISARDVSERKLLLDNLQHQAHHDSLTSLPNRLLLTDRLEQALYRAARHETPVAVLFIDLDGFKAVNDRIGHSGGDQLLIAVAERLRSGLRVDDTLARLGGDEFVVVLEECDQDLAMRMADRLVLALRDITVDGRRFDLSASVGIAIGTGPGVSIDDLLHQSDLAMYQAKSDPDQSVALFAVEPAGALPMAGD